MSETLDALHRAVIANPTDRTVRLVYADALDEAGEPAYRTRAEFIRAQIESESVEHDAHRFRALSQQSSQLFESNWLAWWAPVAESAGLPYPHVAGKRVRDPTGRAGGTRPRRRPANWPYTISAADTTVRLADYGLSFGFKAGFPEEVRFSNFDTPEGGPRLTHRWGAALPLARLALEPFVGGPEWERIHGPHLRDLHDLILERLVADCAPRIAASPYLANLSRLTVNPLGTDPSAFRAIVSEPAWSHLRVLRLTGRLSPENVRDVAAGCTLRHLEEVELELGNPGILGEPIIQAAAAGLQSIVRMIGLAVTVPATAAPRWGEYGPAFEALAAAEWVRRLRVLGIASGHMRGLMGLLAGRPQDGTEANSGAFPDSALLALAAALDRDKLERLVLPAALVSPSAREELTRRMGSTVEFR